MHDTPVTVRLTRPRARRRRLVAATAAALLSGLAACSPAPSPPPTSAAPETAAAPSPSAPTPTPTTPPRELNCSSVVADNRFTWWTVQPSWGLKEQIAVTGGDYTASFGAQDPVEAVLETTRGVACLAYGNGMEASQAWTYVEFEVSQQSIVDAWADSLGLEWQAGPNGSRAYQSEMSTWGHGSYEFVSVGEGWLAIGVGSIPGLSTIDAFSGELRDVDSNEAVSEVQSTQTCSMFFAPHAPGHRPVPFGLRQRGYAEIREPETGALPFRTDRVPSGRGDTVCDGIVWHDGAPESPPTGEPVAANDRCTLYRDVNDEYLAVCDTGWAEISAPASYAAQVLPPEFRGLR